MSIMTEVELLDVEIKNLEITHNTLTSIYDDIDVSGYAIYDVVDSIIALIREKKVYRSSLIARLTD